MILTAIASLILGQGPALICPIMMEETGKDATMIDYNGVRYAMCCAGCDTMFKKDPAKVLSNKKLEGKLVGISLFDPLTGLRIDPKDGKAFSDHNGVRYYFAKADQKAAFDAEPKKFAVLPKTEALFCAVMGHEVKDYASAGGYVDVSDVRYYVCCAGCMDKMKKDATTLAATAKSHVKAPAAKVAPVKKS